MRWTSIFASAVLILVVAGTVLTFRARFADPPINVILLTVESLRADRFTAALAPKFFKAARDAVSFESHRSIASWTAPNIISLLTGLSPFEQGVHARGHAIAADRVTALEKLAQDGWETGSVQAFARTENFQNLGMPVSVGETAEWWIARQRLAGKPFYFWHHYLDTHLPYDPEPSFLASGIKFPGKGEPAYERIQAVRQRPAVRSGSVKFERSDKPYIDALYDGGIRQFDAWFATFWRFFNAAGLREDTVLIVTADHGEELLERQHVGHASTTGAGTLFEESVRVPLFIWWPRRLASTLTEGPSDHLDIMPTVLEALGRNVPEDLSGTSLVRPRRSDSWYAVTSKSGFTEADPDDVQDFIVAAIEDGWKLIATTRRRELIVVRLFDLSNDPLERLDRSRERPDVVGRMLPGLSARLTNLKLPHRQSESGSSPSGKPAPEWLFPTRSRTVSWDDLQGHVYVAWTGTAPSYVLEYSAGSGALSVSGHMAVNGTRKDFGTFSRKYWETWIVPYRQVMLRVRDEDGGRWSDPLTITLSK